MAAQDVIKKFGSISALAEAIGKNRSTVWRWTQPKENLGTGGKVPSSAMDDVMRAAEERGIQITYGDFANP